MFRQLKKTLVATLIAALTAGQMMPCEVTNSFGTCLGTVTCQPPMGFGACSARTPAAELCNGRDDDCDGMTDEEIADTICGVGACERRVPACTNGRPNTCTPGMPDLEVCNGADDDCDGATDEAPLPGVGQGCGFDVGACDPGTLVCQGGALVCVGATNPTTETCNSLDDDCDSFVDEVADECYTFPTGCGPTGCVGTCHPGLQTCAPGGGLGPCVGQVGPATEACNGADDNCNAQIDEGLADLNCGLGACARTTAACVNGMPQTCTPGRRVGMERNGLRISAGASGLGSNVSR